jgi:hypothetical protein
MIETSKISLQIILDFPPNYRGLTREKLKEFTLDEFNKFLRVNRDITFSVLMDDT